MRSIPIDIRQDRSVLFSLDERGKQDREGKDIAENGTVHPVAAPKLMLLLRMKVKAKKNAPTIPNRIESSFFLSDIFYSPSKKLHVKR